MLESDESCEVTCLHYERIQCVWSNINSLNNMGI